MLVIRTGKPGHGKTLNTIKEVDAKAFRTSRVVYYHNITGLKPELLDANWYEFEDPTKWYELPYNSIIVIDEAQGWFGNRDPRHKPGPHLTALETMRKSGFELHLITQDPRFLDTHARRIANVHIHYWRVMKSRQLLRFQSEFVIERVEVMSSFKDADKTRLRIDSKMFDKYTSSNAEHHFRFQPSKKLIWSIIVLITTAFLLFRVYSLYSTKSAGTPDLIDVAASQVTKMGNLITPQQSPKSEPKKDDLTEYLDKRTPRLKNVPSSAPIYDELTQPQTYPKLTCMSSEADSFKRKLKPHQIKNGIGCQCYTQQATRLDIEHQFCMDVVENGYFDHAIPDRGSFVAYDADSQLPPGTQPKTNTRPGARPSVPAARALY